MESEIKMSGWNWKFLEGREEHASTTAEWSVVTTTRERHLTKAVNWAGEEGAPKVLGGLGSIGQKETRNIQLDLQFLYKMIPPPPGQRSPMPVALLPLIKFLAHRRPLTGS